MSWSVNAQYCGVMEHSPRLPTVASLTWQSIQPMLETQSEHDLRHTACSTSITVKVCPLPELNCTEIWFQNHTDGPRTGGSEIERFYQDVIHLTAERKMAYAVWDAEGNYEKLTEVYLQCGDDRWWNVSHINCTGITSWYIRSCFPFRENEYTIVWWLQLMKFNEIDMFLLIYHKILFIVTKAYKGKIACDHIWF